MWGNSSLPVRAMARDRNGYTHGRDDSRRRCGRVDERGSCNWNNGHQNGALRSSWRHRQSSRSRTRRRWSPRGKPLRKCLQTQQEPRRDNCWPQQNGRADSRDDSHLSDDDSSYSSCSDSRSSSNASNKEGSGKGGATIKEKSGGGKDKIVHFSWRKGMVLAGRYQLLRALGDGTFGRVVLAHDRHEDTEVAVKIIRDVKRYMENAKIEARILKAIHKADPDGISRCARMYGTFVHEARYYCLVFEPLGVSLYKFLKRNAFRGFWVQDVQSFARQSLLALSFLHGRLRLTHTDLKPENILLEGAQPGMSSYFPRERYWLEQQARRSSTSLPPSTPYLRPFNSQIKLIDFGNATYDSEHHSSVINTRQYRGPEVVLEQGWKESSDLWSLGCILMELYTGSLLFGTHENLEHLALMEATLQRFPQCMSALASPNARSSFMIQDGCGGLRLRWPEGASSAESEQRVRRQRHLGQLAMRSHEQLADLVYRMLALVPSQRPTPAQALEHPFFATAFND